MSYDLGYTYTERFIRKCRDVRSLILSIADFAQKVGSSKGSVYLSFNPGFMKLKHLILLFTGSFTSALVAQPSTEVYLFDLEKTENNYQLSNPVNVSDNPGYDNQPSFSTDGNTLFFTGSQPDGQTDIMRYDLKSQKKVKITNSDGSEYSPTEVKSGKGISTIILERDGRQLLWKYDLAGKNPEIVVEDLVIGYHCWYNKNTLFSFVLGDPATLQLSDLKTGKNTVIDEKIGRSLHKIPKQKAISYISKASDDWQILSYEPKSGTKKVLSTTLAASEDMAWMPNGTMVMGKGNELFFKKASDANWSILTDLTQFNLNGITRLAINSKGNKIAIVVNE